MRGLVPLGIRSEKEPLLPSKHPKTDLFMTSLSHAGFFNKEKKGNFKYSVVSLFRQADQFELCANKLHS